MNAHRHRRPAVKHAPALAAFWLGLVLFFACLLAVPAHAGTYDGAMGKTSYVLKSGDVNGDGQMDYLVKASPKIVMIPLDDDLTIPIAIPAPSPTFVLLSGAGGAFTLLANPPAATLNHAAWASTTSTLTFSGAQGGYADTVSIKAQGSEQAIFVIAMSAADGQLQLTASNLPTTASNDAPVAIAITNADIPQLSNPAGGTLPGSLSVNSGAAGYSIPIALPPGTADMVPSLSLDYNSDNSNGSAGLGWSVGGFSNIDRCGKTTASEGRADAARLVPEDRLCLDGQRLVLINGAWNDNTAYWADGAEYRTEIDTFGRIKARLTNGKRSFTLENKSGETLYYGDSADSALESVARSDERLNLPHYRWRLSRRADSSGNFISYIYSENPTTGESKPAAIRWGGNSVNGQSHYAKATLNYETRVDPRTSFVSGGHADETLILKSVVTTTDTASDGSGGVKALTYTLAHEVSPTSGRSLLKSVQACDGDGICLPETTFDWGKPNPSAEKKFVPLGGARAGPSATSNRVGLSTLLTADFSGDGKTDLLERFPMTGAIRLFTSSADGTSWVVSTPFSAIGGSNLVVLADGDFDGDGQTDVLVGDQTGSFSFPSISNVRLCISRMRTGQGYACSAVPSLASSYKYQTMVKDVNGDGRDDLFVNAASVYKDELCLSTGTGFACRTVNDSALDVLGDSYRGPIVGSTQADVDGDGRADSITLGRCQLQMVEDRETQWACTDNQSGGILIYGEGFEDQSYHLFNEWYSYPPVGEQATAILPPPLGGSITGDLNADGYTDMIFGSARIQGHDVAMSFSSNVCYSRGDGDEECKTLPASGTGFDHLALTVGDFDGDGVADVLRPGQNTWSTDNFNTYQLCRVGPAASFHRCEPWQGPLFYSVSRNKATSSSSNEFSYPAATSSFQGDFNGDGKTDILTYSGGSWQVYSAADQAKPGEALDKLISTTNGVGLVERVEYAFSNDAAVYSPIATDIDGNVIANAYPVRVASPTSKLIKKISRSNGQGGWLDTTFTYAGYAIDGAGRGSAGFAREDATDVQSGVTKTSWQRREYPFTGMLGDSRTVARTGIVLTKLRQELSSHSIPQAGGKATLFPYIATATTERHDLRNEDLGKSVTTNQYDLYGNLLETHESSWSVPGSVYKTDTVNVFDGDLEKKRLGQLLSVTQTKTVPGSAAISRLMEYTYDAKGRRETATRQSDKLALKLKTTFGRGGNVFGLVNDTTLDWVDPKGVALTRIAEKTVYDTKGRFVQTSTNALNQSVTKTFDVRTGVATAFTNAAGITVSATSDGFGRKSTEVGADGAQARHYLRKCTSGCPADAQTVTIVDTMRAGVRMAAPSLSFQDNGGRVLQTQSWGFDGRKVITVNRYDARSRLQATDWPRFESATPVLASEAEYDDLNRVVKVSTRDEGGTVRSTTTEYAGLRTIISNAKSQSKTETRDVWGRLTSIVDAMNGTTSYEHDSFNNVTKTIDPANNVIAVEYDQWGRKANMRDPDLGWIHYDVDALGQLYKQVSPIQRALGQSITFEYDALGRMVLRSEPDLVSGWEFDKPPAQANCATTKSCGQLVEAYTISGGARTYRRTQAYDAFGRPSATTTYLDATYTTTTEYDAWGRLVRQRHQRGTDASKVFDNRYNAYGHLARIERGALVLWRADALDANGRMLNATLGNGLGVTRTYDPRTGRLTNGAVARPGGAAQLQEGYEYDALGNVTLRSQYWPGSTGFAEDFTYDKLNRLETASVRGGYTLQNFTYDAVGNMLSKTGAGTGSYAYPTPGATSVRPHAVKSIPGMGEFLYDDNGNLKSGAQRTLRWTSFDMPLEIIKTDALGTNASTFVYGAEHQRIRHDKSDGTRTYYAGAMEIETRGNVRTIKTYWPMELGLEIETPSATTLNWTHLDRIGSVVAISDQGGNLREQLAYDSWGKRRALTGIATPDSIDGVVNNRGYTGHEMLDQIDLVHMNGRVYDPLVARFLSADPIIQDPNHSQSFNRYAYVWNNPTNLTDPTGFAAADKRDQQLADILDKERAKSDIWTMAGSFFTAESRSGEGLDASGGKGKQSPASGAKAKRERDCINGSTADSCGTTTKVENKPGEIQKVTVTNETFRKDYSWNKGVIRYLSHTDIAGLPDWVSTHGSGMRGSSGKVVEFWAHGTKDGQLAASTTAKKLDQHFAKSGKLGPKVELFIWYVCNAGHGDNSIAQQYSALHPEMTIMAPDGKLFNKAFSQTSEPYHDEEKHWYGYVPNEKTQGDWRYFRGGKEVFTLHQK